MRLKLLSTLILTGLLFGLAVAVDDKPKPPDFSAFVFSHKYVAEVKEVKADTVTILQKKQVPVGTRLQWKTEEVKLEFAENGYVRWKNLPPKLDEKGKKLNYTSKELEALKLPPGVPGYAAEKTDLAEGHYVEIDMVRPKDVPANKAVFQDFKIKQVMITGMNPAMQKVDGGDKKKP